MEKEVTVGRVGVGGIVLSVGRHQRPLKQGDCLYRPVGTITIIIDSVGNDRISLIVLVDDIHAVNILPVIAIGGVFHNVAGHKVIIGIT